MTSFARYRSFFALPAMSDEELVAFRRSQIDARDPLVVPTVVMAVLLIGAFVGWDLLRDPGRFGHVAAVRLGGCAVVLLLLAIMRALRGVPVRVQGIAMYVAVYGLQAAIGIALGAESPLQMPGLLIVMFFSMLALPRASDSWINVVLAALSLPIVLPPAPQRADLVYAVAHFATVAVLAWAACALMEHASAQGFAYRRRLQQEAGTDALTGVANRREFEKAVVRETGRARRGGQPLALAIIDIDHFKRVNDRHGHDAGDRLLRAVAHALQTHVRRSDLLARIGGEEFALLMLDAPSPGHLLLLERLRQAVAVLRVPASDNEAIGCTVSIGVAEFAAGEADWSSLHKRADQALYTAKETGRDRVIQAP